MLSTIARCSLASPRLAISAQKIAQAGSRGAKRALDPNGFGWLAYFPFWLMEKGRLGVMNGSAKR
jgi:hypothetical protein